MNPNTSPHCGKQLASLASDFSSETATVLVSSQTNQSRVYYPSIYHALAKFTFPIDEQVAYV